MKSFKVSIHTGPLSGVNFDHLIACLHNAGAQELLAGTERLYFQVSGSVRQGYGNSLDRDIVDGIDANIAARNLLHKAFGAACAFQPIVSNCL